MSFKCQNKVITFEYWYLTLAARILIFWCAFLWSLHKIYISSLLEEGIWILDIGGRKMLNYWVIQALSVTLFSAPLLSDSSQICHLQTFNFFRVLFNRFFFLCSASIEAFLDCYSFFSGACFITLLSASGLLEKILPLL